MYPRGQYTSGIFQHRTIMTIRTNDLPGIERRLQFALQHPLLHTEIHCVDMAFSIHNTLRILLALNEDCQALSFRDCTFDSDALDIITNLDPHLCAANASFMDLFQAAKQYCQTQAPALDNIINQLDHLMISMRIELTLIQALQHLECNNLTQAMKLFQQIMDVFPKIATEKITDEMVRRICRLSQGIIDLHLIEKIKPDIIRRRVRQLHAFYSNVKDRTSEDIKTVEQLNLLDKLLELESSKPGTTAISQINSPASLLAINNLQPLTTIHTQQKQAAAMPTPQKPIQHRRYYPQRRHNRQHHHNQHKNSDTRVRNKPI